jgi:hypothetical protein
VFLTRQVEHRRRTSVARGGSLKVSSDGTAVSPAVSTTAPSSNASLIERNGAASSIVSQVADSAQPGKAIALGSAVVQGDGTEIGINEVFQRPVAFGYRALSLSLPK